MRQQSQEQVIRLYDTMKKQFKENNDLYLWIITEQAKYYANVQQNINLAIQLLEKAQKESDFNYYIYSFYLNFLCKYCPEKLVDQVLAMFR